MSNSLEKLDSMTKLPNQGTERLISYLPGAIGRSLALRDRLVAAALPGLRKQTHPRGRLVAFVDLSPLSEIETELSD